MELTNEVKDLAEFISLILVFVTVFFNIRYQGIIKGIKAEKRYGEGNINALLRELKLEFLTSLFPLLIILLASVYIFSPVIWKIHVTTHFEIWDFDPILTSFVFIFILIFGLMAWVIILCGKLYFTFKKMKNSLKK